jgi:hypothetical protein
MFGFSAWIVIYAKQRNNRRFLRGLSGVVRVAVYAAVVSLVLGLFALRRAQADTSEAFQGLGRELSALSDVLGDGKTLRLNGQTIHVASTLVPASVDETLDRFEKHCSENPGVIARAVKALPPLPLDHADGNGAPLPPGALAVAPEDGATMRMGTYRSGDDKEGVVLCLVAGSGPKELRAAASEFARTQDLGALGKMRYASATRTESGSTHVMTAWTDEHFMFGDLLGEGGGDAPGTDSAAYPRLEGSIRLLTAEVMGTTYSVRVYSVPYRVEEAAEKLDQAMTSSGYVRVTGNATNPAERSYLKGGLLITAAIHASEKGTTVSLADLGSNSATPMGQ